MLDLRVAEIAVTLQGEGAYTGIPAVFVRLQGCHRRCAWCDQPEALDKDGGEVWSIAGLAATLSNIEVSHVVVTGGEPMLQGRELEELLIHPFVKGKKFFHLETSGDIYHSVIGMFDVVTVSPKLASAGSTHILRYSKLERILDACVHGQKVQLKFVIGDLEDDINGMFQFLTAYAKYPLNIVVQCEESQRDRIENILVAMLLRDPRFSQNSRHQFRYLRRLHKDINLR